MESSDTDVASGDERQGLKRRAAMALGSGLALAGLGTPAEAATGARSLSSADQLRPAYDVIIVGAGSAGCVVAHRLGQAGRRVLVIEAGGHSRLPAVADPPQWPTLSGGPLDWRYVTVPQAGLGGRVVPYPRGKAVGGSSVINALAYQAGHPAAYDRWPAGWRHADLLPFFKRAEMFSGGGDTWRGGEGPLHVLSLADVAERTPVAAAFVAAAEERGFARTADLGGAVRTGVGWNQLSVKFSDGDYVRHDSACAFLDSLDGAAVDLLADTPVLGLVIEGGRCVGVRLADRIVRTDGEVVLSAGAIDSPRLLMVSGIGPAPALRSMGIPVAVDLPEVGQHLEDHVLLAGVAYRARREVSRSHFNHADALLYVPPADPRQAPDHLIMCLSLPFVQPVVGAMPAPAYTLVPCLMQPRSRGTVRLASADPLASPLIDPNFLSDPADLSSLETAVNLAREIGSARAFDDWREAEVYPGSAWADRATRADFIRRAARPFHHPIGTCRIGAVVDEALRVTGVAGLRVVDASVMPSLPAAMINAAVIAVAERASALMLAG
ncbi:choline dehydrogenase [Enhydrobacter aerosaccus]|uniref:Choline dehydrogenase n=1 Tax=Enhydrobacter aerosaccus TaxID=225324 RepID=A0A1T4T6E8_9HYPH|nr:GMC oxidoreductase [Enhydrobacter aerosaccus]SKA35987.1 choline dehydrogenase [Enhydrobacter aerosaccus]